MTAQGYSPPAEEEFRSGHALGMDHRKLAMWLFIASEVMFFGGLITAFLRTKLQTPTPEQALLDIGLVGINTFVLLASSFTVVLGLNAIQNGSRRGLMAYLGLTMVLGLAFLAGQGYEFVALYEEGMTLSGSLYGSSFFTLTSFHGLHVLIGVVWAGLTLLRAARGGYSAERYEGVETFGLYWHFVDIVWIVLFTIIYLI